MRRLAALALSFVLQEGAHAMAIDVNPLWDYSQPAVSERRFRDAMTGASAHDKLVLQTQVARTWGLRRDFARTREILDEIAPQLPGATPEAQVRYELEQGRTYASATHKAEEQTAASREAARSHYMRAFELAQAAKLDNLAIDALHMMPFVDTEPAAQLEWDLKALRYMEASPQPEARTWEGSLYNNVGYALHLAGRYDEALENYRKSLAVHERAGRAANVRIAWWMIASTFRAMKRFDEAIDIQLRLEREWDEAGRPDPYVYEELEHLYRAKNNAERAAHYAAKLEATRKQ
jgi:tetratricopeptide (TPR) repeat protein